MNQETLHPTRDVMKGEEIAISYMPEFYRGCSEDGNQNKSLEQTYGFKCVCEAHSYDKRKFAQWASGGADLMVRIHQLAVNGRTRLSEFPCFGKLEILKSTNVDWICSHTNFAQAST
jgi:hypothetical protein